MERDVKEGCFLSAARYILAISPLIKLINSDRLISGTCVGHKRKVKAIAYVDDVTVMKNQLEVDVLINHLNLHKLASGAKLNRAKIERVWIRAESDKRNINIYVEQEIKILGLTICNRECAERNWKTKLKSKKR